MGELVPDPQMMQMCTRHMERIEWRLAKIQQLLEQILEA